LNFTTEGIAVAAGVAGVQRKERNLVVLRREKNKEEEASCKSESEREKEK